MANYKQAFAWWSFMGGGADPDEVLRAAVRMGYQGVDLVEQENWKLVRRCGLTISAINGHASLDDGLNRVENRARIVDELTNKLLLAISNDIPNLICFTGNRYGADEMLCLEITAETLRQVAPLAEDAGVNLVLEVLNSKVDHCGYQADRTEWAVRVIEMVASPCVKVLYDVYHMQIMEGDLLRSIQRLHPHFAHYHTAGNPGRNDLDDAQEINYHPIFQAIAATGFDGFVCHEFMPKGDAIPALKAAFNLANVD
jgi:hydroxypyruvate isomerase